MKSRWQVITALALLVSAGWAQDAPKKISRAEAMSAVATRVQPEYPPIARQMKIEGMVELEAVIGENGNVAKVDIVSGNAMLTSSAALAVKQWKFKPFVEDGKPIRVVAPISLNFKM
jgi:protein TonB